MDPVITSSGSGVLSSQAILDEMSEDKIRILPFREENLSTSSYDVTLGRFFWRQAPRWVDSVLNMYDDEHIKNAWRLETAEKHSEMVKSRKLTERLKNVGDDDEIILIHPGETILAHTNEFIGGRENITTMMKARSSIGRNCIEVCKCFPPETRLLTRNGFKFVASITLEDEVATYHPPSKSIEYHRPSRLIRKVSTTESGPHQMVRVQQKHDEDDEVFGENPTNHFDLSTTDDHDWYVKSGHRDTDSKKVYYGHHAGQEVDYAKVEASSLCLTQSTGANECFRVLTSAEGGLRENAPFPFMAHLELFEEDEVLAFLTFFGYWLGNGIIAPNGCVSCTSTKETDKMFIRNLFIRSWLSEGVDYYEYDEFESSIRFQIMKPSWNKFFNEMYGKKCEFEKSVVNSTDDLSPCNKEEYDTIYDGELENVSTKTATVDGEMDEFDESTITETHVGLESDFWPEEKDLPPIESTKWFPEWVFTLSVPHLRAIIDGYVMSDEHATNKDVIFTSSMRMRDQLMRVLIHAGYSPFFTRYRKADTLVETSLDERQTKAICTATDSWQIFIGRRSGCVIDKARDVTRYEFEGTVYCLTVPNNLVFAHTAKLENGIITECSKTAIIGQCAGWGDVGYVNIWTMEITNNSKRNIIPLVVNRRIAQIVFFYVTPIQSERLVKSYSGKYQSVKMAEKKSEESSEEMYEHLFSQWNPSMMLPKMSGDYECSGSVSKGQ